MRTTLDLPDPLYRRLKLKAAQEGKTLKEVVVRLLEEGLARTPLAPGPFPKSRRRAGASRREPTPSAGTSSRTMDLPDLNVWFALLVPEHPFHARALRYWREAEDPVLVRVTA